MSKRLDNVTLSDLMPDSISKDSGVSAAAQSIDTELRAVANGLDLPSIYARIDELTSLQLDHLAASRNFTIWRDTWPLDLKRSVAKQMVAQKARMGTLSAVKLVLQSLGSSVSIKEWFEESPPAEPHTFKITVALSEVEGTLTSEMQEDCFAMLDEAKPVRSHYTFTLSINKKGTLQVVGVPRTTTFARIEGKRSPQKVHLPIANVLRPVISNRINFN